MVLLWQRYVLLWFCYGTATYCYGSVIFWHILLWFCYGPVMPLVIAPKRSAFYRTEPIILSQERNVTETELHSLGEEFASINVQTRYDTMRNGTNNGKEAKSSHAPVRLLDVNQQDNTRQNNRLSSTPKCERTIPKI